MSLPGSWWHECEESLRKGEVRAAPPLCQVHESPARLILLPEEVGYDACQGRSAPLELVNLLPNGG